MQRGERSDRLGFERVGGWWGDRGEVWLSGRGYTGVCLFVIVLRGTWC